MKKIQIKLNKKQRQLREKIVAYILVVICSVFLHSTFALDVTYSSKIY